MTLGRWSPFRGGENPISTRRRGAGDASPLMQLQDEMNRMFQEFMGSSPMGWSVPTQFREQFSDLAQHKFIPKVDVCETDDSVQVSAELPGMTADDIEINCERDRLRIRGEKSSEETRNEEGVYHTERSFGSFERIIPLPHEVKVDGAEASFKNGVLTVEIPRVEGGTSSRKLDIKSD
jgi:HSP20 family protein